MRNVNAAAVAGALLVCLGTTAAHADDDHAQPGYGFAPTVAELLKADAEKARRAALDTPIQASSAPLDTRPESIKAPAQAPQPQLELLGLYGRAGTWKAEVRIDGRMASFGAGDTNFGWRARGVTATCIELIQSRAHLARKLCSAN